MKSIVATFPNPSAPEPVHIKLPATESALADLKRIAADMEGDIEHCRRMLDGHQAKWTLTFLFEDSQHESFAEAFRELYRKFQANPVGEQLLEAIWIKRDGDPLPIMFGESVERAMSEGILRDGELVAN